MSANTKINWRQKIPWAAILFLAIIVVVILFVWIMAGTQQPLQVLEVQGNGIQNVEPADPTVDGFNSGLAVSVDVTQDVEYVHLISNHGVLMDRQRVYAGTERVVVGSAEMDVGEKWSVVAVNSDGNVIGVAQINHKLKWPWERPIVGSNK